MNRREFLKVSAAASAVGAMVPAESVQIKTTVRSPLIDFALREVRQALTSAGYTVGDQGTSILLELETGKPESFTIHRGSNLVAVRGADLRGLMYGALELSEKLNLGIRLGELKDESQTPFLPIRAVKFNPPLAGTGYMSEEDFQNGQWFWDLDYWQAFLDMAARNRYNSISFWSAHPYDQMVRIAKYPEATSLPAEELDRNIMFFTKLFRMARERGIEPYLITWNILLSPAFAKAHHLPGADIDNDLVRDYQRECIKSLLATYPDLVGLGTTQGEAMDVIPEAERAAWIADVYFRAIRESGRREVPFVLRYWGGTPAATQQAAAAYDRGPVYLDIKYNGEHLYSSTRPHVEDAAWLHPPHNYKLLWHLRNDDIYIFRWGNPPWVSELIRNLAQTDTVGFTEGSEIDIPGIDRSHTPETRGHVTWKYKFEKMWFRFALWGRLGYNPDLPEAVWQGYFRRHYGPAGDALYEATVAASRIAPLITSYHWNYMNGDWYVEASIGSWNTSWEQPRINYRRIQMYHDIRNYVFNNSIDESLEDPVRYAARILAPGTPAETARSPLDVSNELASAGRTALGAEKIRDPGEPYGKEFACAQFDNLAYGHLGLYYAEKLRAAAALSLFLFSNDESYKSEAIEHLRNALAEWKALVAVTEKHYIPHEVWLFGPFHWNMYTSAVQDDILIAENIRAFEHQGQKWQVAAEGAGESAGKDLALEVLGPFDLAGLHEWLLYFDSRYNRHLVKQVLGSVPRGIWKQRFQPGSGERLAIELAGKPASTVHVDRQVVNPSVVASALAYQVFLPKEGGEVEVLGEEGAVPQVAMVAGNGESGFRAPAASAEDVIAPLTKTPAGTLAIPQSYILPPEHRSLSGVAGDLDDHGTARYKFRLSAPGFYRVACLVRSPGGGRRTFSFSVDYWNGDDKAMSIGPSSDWQWVNSKHALALGAGEHVLRLRFAYPGDEAREVRIEPIPYS